MTDLFKGYDLTAVADKVAEASWARLLREAKDKGFEKQVPEWSELGAVQKFNYKATLLPIITDVLNALESDEVKPAEPRAMVEYGYGAMGSDRSDPRWYENQEHQHDTSTATVWCLHMHVHKKCRDAILERMSRLTEPTGEYTWGDSWRQWCEPAEGDHDTRLGIYFYAAPERAKAVAEHLADHATFAGIEALGGDNGTIPAWTLTTAGDYAEAVR